jgi:AraC-like DNA-binding protein
MEPFQQHDFLGEVRRSFPLTELFEHLPGVGFWVKDANLRFVMSNQSIAEQCGHRSESDLIGHNDFECFPEALAEKFWADDSEVLRTQRKLLNIVELTRSEEGTLEWYLTNKLPIVGPTGVLLGVAGTTRKLQRAEHLGGELGEMADVVQFISDNRGRPLEVKEVAAHAGVSVSQLERRFRSFFRMSPRAFIIKVRVMASCKALTRSNLAIAEVALENGFYDPSHFYRHFTKHLGMRPSEYRARFRKPL